MHGARRASRGSGAVRGLTSASPRFRNAQHLLANARVEYVELAQEVHKNAKERAFDEWRHRRYEAAHASASEAIEANKGSEVLYRFRSTVARKLGKYDEAARDADKAVELNPRGPVNFHCQATAQQQLRRLPEVRLTNRLSPSPHHN